MAFFFSCSKARLTTALPPSPPFSFLLSSMSMCYGHQYDLSCQSCCACSAHLEVRNLALLNPDCTRMISSLTNAHTHTHSVACVLHALPTKQILELLYAHGAQPGCIDHGVLLCYRVLCQEEVCQRRKLCEHIHSTVL